LVVECQGLCRKLVFVSLKVSSYWMIIYLFEFVNSCMLCEYFLLMIWFCCIVEFLLPLLLMVWVWQISKLNVLVLLYQLEDEFLCILSSIGLHMRKGKAKKGLSYFKEAFGYCLCPIFFLFSWIDLFVLSGLMGFLLAFSCFCCSSIKNFTASSVSCTLLLLSWNALCSNTSG
jgi:hypothetical protein